MKKVILFQLLIMVSLAMSGQEVSVRVEYPAVVEAGQQFNVSWTVNAGGGEFSAPAFTGFYKLIGPQTSYSSSTQILNGKVSREISYSYVYFLQAINEGKYVLPPAKFTLKNKAYYSDSIRIEVVGSGAQQPGQRSGAADAGSNQVVESGGRDLFVNLLLDRKEVFMGESISATVKIYTRVNLSGVNEIKLPSFDKFLKSDLPGQQTQPRDESVNGLRYTTGVVQQFLLYPQVAGDITIDPVQLTVIVRQQSSQSDLFSDFFAQDVPKVIASQPVKVRVKPLPGTRPADFSGVVGKLDMKASLGKDSVNVNDAISFKITISGNGNLKIAQAPVFKLSPDIEVFDPKITDDIKSSINGAAGQRTFEYLLIPRHYGDFTIPPVTYSYFNTASGRYETLTTREFRFHAIKGNDQNTGITVYGGVSKEDVKYLGKDIRFIKSDAGKITQPAAIIVSKPSFLSFYAATLLLFLVILFVRREHIRRNSDVSRVRNRKAGKIAVRRLRTAELCLKNGEIDRFYDEILKSLWGYLSDKLNIPVSDLTRTNAVAALTDRGINEDVITNLTKILDSCEFARYAPSSSGTEASDIYEGAARVIKSVENSIA